MTPPQATSATPALAGLLSAREFLGLLHVLSQSRRSGRLTLTSSAARALLILRGGRLIYAASTSARETLGNILVCEQLIDEDTLHEALRRQHLSGRQQRLGVILEEMDVLTPDILRLVVELQARRVLQEVLDWDRGYFHFEPLEIDDGGEVAVELEDFLVDDGLRLDSMLLDLSERPDLAQAAKLQPRAGEDVLSEVGAGPTLSLRSAMRQISQPLFNAEMTLALLDYAGSMLDRGVLLLRRSDRLLGMAQFGLVQSSEPSPAIRRMSLPLDQPSAFRSVVERGETVRGVLDATRVHQRFLDALGESTSVHDAVLLPLVVRGEVVAVFYGDSRNSEIASVVSLEALLLQAGLSLEKGMLEARVQELEAKLAQQREQEPEVTPPRELPNDSIEALRIGSLLAGRAVDSIGD